MNKPTSDFSELLAAAQVFGLGSVPLKTIASENKAQVETFTSFDPAEVASTFGGLLTTPELQSNCLRLETLVHLALAFCRGRKKPQSREISRWFSEFGEGRAGSLEDPAEDVFVSNITTPRGNFRILGGIWETSSFYLQRFVNVVEAMPQGSGYSEMRECIYALLKLSDLVCQRAQLTRNQLGNTNPHESLPGGIANSLSALRRRVRFSSDDLRANGISIEHLQQFGFDPGQRKNLAGEVIGHSALERYPIIVRNDEFVLVLPTAPSAAIRRFVIERMTSAGMRDALAAGLGREYQRLFAKTPLLGGKSGAPIKFQRTNSGRLASVMEAAPVSIVTGDRYEAAFFNVENVAERAFVERAIEGFAHLAQQPLSPTELDSITSAIVPNTAARETHVFRARQFRDYVRASLPKWPLLIDTADVAALRLGIGWRVREKDAGRDILGKDACTAFLNDAVRLVEDELCSELRQYDRASTIKFALKNHESAAAERDWWDRTASAVLALRDDREATRAAMAKHEFQLNGVFQASRLVIEFALCECPLSGGRKPGCLNFSRFMAKVGFIQHLGGWSDAIAWDVMEPRVKIAPLGDIFVNPEFIDNVMMPYGRAGSDVRVDEAVKNYARNLQDRESEPDGKGSLEETFLEAWNEEFGVTFDETRHFIDSIEELGLEEKQGVFMLPRSRLIEAGGKALTPQAVAALVDALSLKRRASWRAIPTGYEERDIHPWRFRRRLTTLRKPLVQIDDSPDPAIIVAPGLVRDAFVYMLDNYYSGDYPARQLKQRMRTWGGTYRNRVGSKFSNEVGARLRESGWQCDCEVQVTALLRKGFDKNYGDVDVLAWNVESKRVLIIECKDVQYRKTVGEIAEQISDFRGEIGRDGKPDLLLKHLNRVELISRHLKELAAYVGIEDIPAVESHLVFKNPVPMQFAWKRMEARVRLHTFVKLKDI